MSLCRQFRRHCCLDDTQTFFRLALRQEKMVCPECKSVETDAAKISAALAAYTSADSATVQDCGIADTKHFAQLH